MKDLVGAKEDVAGPFRKSSPRRQTWRGIEAMMLRRKREGLVGSVTIETMMFEDVVHVRKERIKDLVGEKEDVGPISKKLSTTRR
jgi:hypothetical protein